MHMLQLLENADVREERSHFKTQAADFLVYLPSVWDLPTVLSPECVNASGYGFNICIASVQSQCKERGFCAPGYDLGVKEKEAADLTRLSQQVTTLPRQ